MPRWFSPRPRSGAPWRSLAGGLTAAVAIGGCGGSSHSGSVAAKTTPSPPVSGAVQGPSASTPTPTATATATGYGSTRTATTRQPSTPATGGAGLPAASSSGRGARSGGAGAAGPGGGSTSARVPATFTIAAGGSLQPSTVSAPAFIAVELTVTASDGKAHQVVLQTPQPHTLSVVAGRRASALIPGQRAGRYSLLIDGAPRGALLIGGEPGP